MKITKREIEEILGYEIANFKVTKKAYRGTKVSSLTVTVVPEKTTEHVTITIRPKK